MAITTIRSIVITVPSIRSSVLFDYIVKNLNVHKTCVCYKYADTVVWYNSECLAGRSSRCLVTVILSCRAGKTALSDGLTSGSKKDVSLATARRWDLATSF